MSNVSGNSRDFKGTPPKKTAIVLLDVWVRSGEKTCAWSSEMVAPSVAHVEI